MAAVKPFTYLLGEPPFHPNSGFRKPDGIHHGTTGAQPIGGGASIQGQEGNTPIDRSNAEMQNNNELSRQDTPAFAFRSFEANLHHLQTDSEYEGNNRQTANSSNSRLKSAKATHEPNVPVVPPKPTNDFQTVPPPADRSSTDCTVGGVVARERLDNGGQLKEPSNPEDSDNNDEYLYGHVKHHNKDSKNERREDMTPKRTHYENPAPFSYTDPIRAGAAAAAAATAPWGHGGEKRPTSVDENKQLQEFEDVVIDDFSDLCSSLSSIADGGSSSSRRDDHHRLFDRSAPVVPSSKTESRKEEELAEYDDPTKRPKRPKEITSDVSSTNSRNASMPSSTVAAKPFTYLTGEIPALKSSGFLRPGEIGGASSSPETNASPLPTRNPCSTLEKDADTGHRMVQKLPCINESSHQDSINTYHPVDAVLHPKTYYVEQKAAASDLTINQQKTSVLQNQLKITAGNAKKVPSVPQKRANDQAEGKEEEEGGDSSDFLRFTSRESLFGDRENNGQQVDRLKNGERRSEDDSDASERLYGQVKQRHLRDAKTDQDQNSSSSAVDEIIPPPFSYTEPIRPAAAAAPLRGAKPSPSNNDKGKKSEFEGGGAVVDLDDLCPPSSSPSTDVQTLFDNFILVKATSNPEKPRQIEFTSKEPPTKRLKLLELFDPPPPSFLGPRKVSILGVTSTESSDFHVDYKPKIANGNNNNYDRTKGPVSTFDNPDYNISSDYTESRTNLHTVVDFRSDSSKSLVASNSMDRTGEKSVQEVSARRRRCDSRLCIAILVTALVTSVICLGAGFVAGWFGRGRSIG